MKTLIIYASLGEGHKKAAFALKDFLGAECLDLLDFYPPLFKKLQQDIYLYITQKIPFLWESAFNISKSKAVRFAVEKANAILLAGFIAYLRENKPEIIIATHFFPLPLISLIKKETGVKVIVVVTDMRSHPIWAHQCADNYITPTQAAGEDLIKQGISRDKITAGYVALRQGFLQEIPQDALRRNFSLDSRPAILFMSSATGNFPFLEKSLDVLSKKFNIFIIYGKNNRLKNLIERMNKPSVKGFVFYENIWELIRLSTVIIAKPGGLTTFEGVFCKKPFVFTHFIPGQEKENMDLLIAAGAARYVRSAPQLLDAIDYFCGKQKELNEHYPLEFKDIRQIDFLQSKK